MIVICAGMYRSGSTWQYQVVNTILTTAGVPVTPLGFLDSGMFETFRKTKRESGRMYTMKTHEGHPSFRPVVEAGNAIVLYSYRDLRDVVFSMIEKAAWARGDLNHFRTFLTSCLKSDEFWTGLRPEVIQRYETWVLDNRPVIRKIAQAVGVCQSEETTETIRQSFSFETNKHRITQIANQFSAQGMDLSDPKNALEYDPQSLLHWNHMRRGEVGEWQVKATVEEQAVLLEVCGPWLRARGYLLQDSHHPAEKAA
jgi:hypothetical protein